MITPESLADPGTESAHQKALFCWAALPETLAKYPELALMFAIPNGGERNKVTAARLKAEGVKAGVPDIFLPVARCVGGEYSHFGLFIEMKKSKGVLSDAQDDWHGKLLRQGYMVNVCFGWQEAVNAIIDYLEN